MRQQNTPFSALLCPYLIAPALHDVSTYARASPHSLKQLIIINEALAKAAHCPKAAVRMVTSVQRVCSLDMQTRAPTDMEMAARMVRTFHPGTAAATSCIAVVSA